MNNPKPQSVIAVIKQANATKPNSKGVDYLAFNPLFRIHASDKFPFIHPTINNEEGA